jgi:hypothetical protein
MFTMLVALAWLSYPVAGSANVAAEVLQGKRSRGAGFSFLPELLVFPAVFLGVAALLDHFILPWGRRIIGGVCLAMFVAHLYVFVRARRQMRAARDTER